MFSITLSRTLEMPAYTALDKTPARVHTVSLDFPFLFAKHEPRQTGGHINGCVKCTFRPYDSDNIHNFSLKPDSEEIVF